MRASSVRNTSTNRPLLELEPGGQRAVEPAHDGLLREALGHHRAAGVLGGQREGALVRVRRRGRPRRRGRCASASAALTCAPDITMRFARAGPTRRVSRCVPPPPGMMPEQDLGLAERGVVGRDAQITRERELASAAERETGDRRDHHARDRIRGRRAPRRTCAPISAASSGPPNSAMSAPAAKMRSPPVTHDRARRIGRERSAHLAHLVEQRGAQRVDLGTVERMTATSSSRRSSSTNIGASWLGIGALTVRRGPCRWLPAAERSAGEKAAVHREERLLLRLGEARVVANRDLRCRDAAVCGGVGDVVEPGGLREHRFGRQVQRFRRAT